jgi:phosphomevalonate kinase
LNEHLTALSGKEIDWDGILNTLNPIQKYLFIISQRFRWDNVVKKFTLPDGLVLRLADLDAGSSTPSLVGEVLAWRRDNPVEADAVWKSLGKMNSRLVDLFAKLNQMSKDEGYRETLNILAGSPAVEWRQSDAGDKEIREVLVKVYKVFQEIRAGLRSIGEEAGVSVEPESMTRLLDECMSMPAVLIAGVPGAGIF